MTVEHLAKKLGLAEVCVCDLQREIDGAYCGDLLSWVMGRATSGNVWVTIMSNINVVAVASLCDASAVILAEGVELDAEICDKARAQGINIFRSKKTSFELCCEIGECLKK